MNKNHIFISLLALATAFSLLPQLQAQDRKHGEGSKSKMTGNIDLELNSQRKDPYQVAQEQTLNYLKNLKVSLMGVSASNRKLLMPEPETLNYLGGLYLFCSIKRGTCPSVLESLFEIDLVNSKLSNVTLCPVMKSFWKRYLDNDLEDRLKYSISTGFVSKVNEFNSKERPRYLHCENTLKEIFKDGESASSLFAKRYQSSSRPLKAIDETIAMITAVAENNTNVFIATGAQS